VHHQRPADAVYLVVEQKDEVFHGSHHELVRAERFDWRQLTPMEQLVPRGQQELQQLAQQVLGRLAQQAPEQLVLEQLALEQLAQQAPERRARREFQQLAQQLLRQLERAHRHPCRLPS